MGNSAFDESCEGLIVLEIPVLFPIVLASMVGLTPAVLYPCSCGNLKRLPEMPFHQGFLPWAVSIVI